MWQAAPQYGPKCNLSEEPCVAEVEPFSCFQKHVMCLLTCLYWQSPVPVPVPATTPLMLSFARLFSPRLFPLVKHPTQDDVDRDATTTSVCVCVCVSVLELVFVWKEGFIWSTLSLLLAWIVKAVFSWIFYIFNLFYFACMSVCFTLFYLVIPASTWFCCKLECVMSLNTTNLLFTGRLQDLLLSIGESLFLPPDF